MKRTATLLSVGFLTYVVTSSTVTATESDDILSHLVYKRDRSLKQDGLNNRPIIGVLTQPIDDGMKQKNP